MSWNIDQFLERLGPDLPTTFTPLVAPPFAPPTRPTDPGPGRHRPKVALAVASMQHHTTDEGHQIMLALKSQGYKLYGRGCDHDETDVRKVWVLEHPEVVFVQDKREWDVKDRDFRDPQARFANVGVLKDKHDCFKVTILKDAQARPHYHRESAYEMGCHAWVVNYHPRIVHALAPYTRPQHLIRTYHTLDPKIVPAYSKDRKYGCLLSGAVSGAYPLRSRLANDCLRGTLACVDYLPHPGYHRRHCCTPAYMELLSQYKVAICTSSKYGYALRKIMEATACGCVVLTDLPCDERLPMIDGNLVRIDPNMSTYRVRGLVQELVGTYDPERQAEYAKEAINFYDYRAEGQRLALGIDSVRESYDGN